MKCWLFSQAKRNYDRLKLIRPSSLTQIFPFNIFKWNKKTGRRPREGKSVSLNSLHVLFIHNGFANLIACKVAEQSI